jgi:DNA-binding Lrp family transcriptional regulator
MVKAYVLANCDIGYERCVIEELKTIPCVKEAHGIMGAYDIVAEIESSSREELQRTITLKIRKVGMIKSTLTLEGIEGKRYSNIETV